MDFCVKCVYVKCMCDCGAAEVGTWTTHSCRENVCMNVSVSVEGMHRALLNGHLVCVHIFLRVFVCVPVFTITCIIM